MRAARHGLDLVVAYRRERSSSTSGAAGEAEWRNHVEVFRNITRRKLCSTLTIAGIVIGVLALTTMGAIAEHFNALLTGGVTYISSNVRVGPPNGQTAILPISKATELQSLDGVQAVFPSYTFLANPGALNFQRKSRSVTTAATFGAIYVGCGYHVGCWLPWPGW